MKFQLYRMLQPVLINDELCSIFQVFIAQLHRRARLLNEGFHKWVLDLVIAHQAPSVFDKMLHPESEEIANSTSDLAAEDHRKFSSSDVLPREAARRQSKDHDHDAIGVQNQPQNKTATGFGETLYKSGTDISSWAFPRASSSELSKSSEDLERVSHSAVNSATERQGWGLGGYSGHHRGTFTDGVTSVCGSSSCVEVTCLFENDKGMVQVGCFSIKFS